MSHLSFGLFSLADPMDSRDLAQLSWRLVRHAADHDICLILGCNIPQAIALEMLGVEKSSIPTNAIPFLATASPLEDTSYSLIGADTLDIPPHGTDTPRIEQSLRRLESLFRSAFRESAVRTIELHITEGFDTDFKTVFSGVDEFFPAAVQVFRENDNWWPSVKFIVRREAAS